MHQLNHLVHSEGLLGEVGEEAGAEAKEEVSSDDQRSKEGEVTEVGGRTS